MALWSGRFTENVSEFTQRFGASLPVDKALYAQDIAGSQAHARMLASAGVIEPADAEAIVEGLDRVKARIEAGDFAFDINDEDIHMSVERALIADIGDAGARLHTGRSRNDQVATDTRLFAKQRCEDLMAANVALLVTLKALPLAYNKDLQEDKEGAIDAAKTLEDCLVCAAGMIETMRVVPEAMTAQAKKGYLAATDVADYLAKKGMPFRRAHEVVGHLVLVCEQRGCDLDDLTLADFKAESDLFEEDITASLDLESIVAARTTEGGTGHAAVRAQLALAKDALAADEAVLAG